MKKKIKRVFKYRIIEEELYFIQQEVYTFIYLFSLKKNENIRLKEIKKWKYCCEITRQPIFLIAYGAQEENGN